MAYEDTATFDDAPLHDDAEYERLGAAHAQRHVETNMLSIPEADEVLPKRRNHGLKPSEDLDEMILQCYILE